MLLVLGQHNSAPGSQTRVVDTRTAPHVLVLATHDATRWVVTAAHPTALKRIVLTGYADSTAEAPIGRGRHEHDTEDALVG